MKPPMEAARRYQTRFGVLSMRPETPGDEAFLFKLFASHADRPLRQAGLAEAAVATMVDLQYRSANATHRALFPEALYSIIERDGAPVGRLIEHDEGETVYFVDFALLPELQARGLGTAFIEQVANAWGLKGRAARVEVAYGNAASLRLCTKLGFVQIEDARMGYVNLRREPPKAAG
jgi:GNAT superfamily N-acetyltransferase